MKIEAGKRYLRRDGKVTGRMEYGHSVGGRLYDPEHGIHAWQDDGRWSRDGSAIYDLLAEVTDHGLLVNELLTVEHAAAIRDALRQSRPHPDIDESVYREWLSDTVVIPADELPATPDAYAPLRRVFDAAFEQAATGKGNQRHANKKPFVDQRLLTISRDVGPRGPIYQVCKKAQEAADMFDRGEHDAAIAELRGAMVYAAATIMLIEERKG